MNVISGHAPTAAPLRRALPPLVAKWVRRGRSDAVELIVITRRTGVSATTRPHRSAAVNVRKTFF